MIKVTRQNNFTGKLNTMELPLTQEDFDERSKRSWSLNPAGGTEHMQDVFPDLNADQREFLMTGITPEEWADMFTSDGDEIE